MDDVEVDPYMEPVQKPNHSSSSSASVRGAMARAMVGVVVTHASTFRAAIANSIGPPDTRAAATDGVDTTLRVQSNGMQFQMKKLMMVFPPAGKRCQPWAAGETQTR